MKITIGSPPRAYRNLRKILMAMNLTAIILLSATLTVSARGYTQTVTLNVKDAPLKTVFVEINEQTGFNFLYSDEDLADTKSVTLNVKDASLEKVLKLCFKNQPLNYSISNNTIVVMENRKIVETIPTVEPPPGIDVHGRLLDEKGQPVAGATVTVKGTTIATTTDAEGNFVLNGVDPNTILIFTATNIEKFEEKLKGRTNLLLSATTKVSPLDEVQVIAYGTTSERLATGNITTVTRKEIEKQPVSNSLLALEGQVPGLFVTQTSGVPGTGVNIKVQGQNSINAGSDPLYVIDGVPYAGQLLYTQVGSPMGSGSPFSFINPEDVESITVLKDADATAIYGSRAANGAILITTKKGAPGKTSVNFDIQNGWGNITRTLPTLNTQQYLEMRHEAFKNDGLVPGPADFDINGIWDTSRYTNWQKVLAGGTAEYRNATMTVSGGNAITQYLVSGTWHMETTPFIGNFSDKKGSVNFNLTTGSLDQRFKLQLSANYMVDNNHLPSSDLTTNSEFIPPDAPALYKPDGSINWEPNSSGATTFQNPAATINTQDKIGTNNLIGHSLISYNILPGLEIKASLGYTNREMNGVQTMPLSSYQPEYRSFIPRMAVYENNNINSWITEPQLAYKTNIGKGNLEALIGTTIEQNNSSGRLTNGSGYSSDFLLENIAAAATLTSYNEISSIYKYNAFFSRLNFNWQNKYIVDLTGRRDGSSRFGSANEFHNFGAIGTSWIFSSEKYIHNKFNFLSFGKLTASYGTTGNDQIGDYQFRSLYSPTYQGVPYQGITGLAPTGLSNPYLQWEETRKLYFALNLGFLKDRVLLNVGYADNRSSNQLLGYSLPSITGFYGISSNLPATVQNTSWEFIVKTKNVVRKNFSWTSNINVTIPRNRLLSFPDFENSGYASTYAIGKTITGLGKVFHLLGVDPETGSFQFLGADGKPTFIPDYSKDRTVLIDMNPKFYGGFQNDFVYKGIELSVFFQFVKQIGNTDPFGDLPGYFGTTGFNQPIWVLNRWQKPGDKSLNQRFSTYKTPDYLYQAFYANQSDAIYGDASYIRLKNVSLSWQIPKPMLKKIYVQSCQLYVRGQNLLTITNFHGIDPENQNVGALPPLRVFTIGLRVGL